MAVNATHTGEHFVLVLGLPDVHLGQSDAERRSPRHGSCSGIPRYGTTILSVGIIDKHAVQFVTSGRPNAERPRHQRQAGHKPPRRANEFTKRTA